MRPILFFKLFCGAVIVGAIAIFNVKVAVAFVCAYSAWVLYYDWKDSKWS